jgi:hypothetical protein
MSAALATASAPPAETVKVPRRLGLLLLALAGAMGFVALGVFFLVEYPREPRAWFAGLAGIAFFGWASSVLVRRLLCGWTMTIGPEGFTIPGPTFQSKLVRWRDVEAIDAAQFGPDRIGRGTNVAIRLKSCADLASQYSAEEARAMARRNRFLRAGAAAAPYSPYTPYTGISSGDVARAQTATGPASDVAGIFANRRAAYGYDIVLTAGDIDRGADDFAAYLNSFRKRYAPDTVHA